MPRMGEHGPVNDRGGKGINWRRILPGLVIVVALAGYGLWKHNQPDLEALGAQVKTSMQQTLSTDSNFSQYQMKVQKVDVIHKSGNEYQGLATVSLPSGSQHRVSVDITYDGDQMYWQAPPGSFMFAIQDSLPAGYP